MAFNHYAKIKRILEVSDSGWTVRRINKSTATKNFKGEIRQFSHYYRIYDKNGEPIPYCKFQQMELFLKTMNVEVGDLVIVED